MRLLRTSFAYLEVACVYGHAHICCWVQPFLLCMCEISDLDARGGLGLAAIQVARAAGARVLATAGSPEKRAHQRKQGVRDVLSSRDLHFAEHLGRAGEGQPSVVLNSLTSPGEPYK